MTSVTSVISFMDAHQPGLSAAKMRLLLFFVQGRHLAAFGDPLFPDALYAAERGITLDARTGEIARPVEPERHRQTIGHTLVVYAGLPPVDLRTLVTASVPWQRAMRSTDGPRIEPAWLRDWFRRPGETDDPDGERLTRAETVRAATFLRTLRGS